MKFNMHKTIQNSVCFNFGRRAGDGDDEHITLRDVLFVVVLFADMYALDAAAHELAVHFLAPFFGIHG